MAFTYTIKVTPSGGSAVTLAESPDSVPVSGESFTDERSVEIVDRVRAAAAALRDRLNRRTTLQFTVTRQHASIAAAIEYQWDHRDDVPSAGSLEIKIVDGATTKTFTGDCLIPKVDLVSRRGLTTIWTYTIIITNLTAS